MAETNDCAECGFRDESVAPEEIAPALRRDRPVAEGPGPDEAAADAEGLAVSYEAVPAAGWHRVHIGNGVEGSVLFTGRRAVHEGRHHLLDIGRVLRAVREQTKGGG